MKQLTIQYNGQLPKVETLKETATYKRKLAFLKKADLRQSECHE